MIIAYVANTRYPSNRANALQKLRMCEALGSLGHEVTLYVRTNFESVDIFRHYDVRPCFRVEEIPSPFWTQLTFVPQGINNRLQWAYFALRARLHSRRAGTELVITRDPRFGWFFNNFLLDVHELPQSRRSPWLRCLLKRACGCIAVTPGLLRDLANRGVAKERISFLPNGVSIETFASKLSKRAALAQLPVSKEVRDTLEQGSVLMYTGRFMTNGQEKGIADILKALALLADHKHLYFAAVGGTEDEIHYYQTLAHEQGVEARCIWLGRFTQPELARFQRVADVLLMPFPDQGHYREHMSPLKTFEYMASGRPIVASNLPSIQAILRDDEAFWCRHDDPEHLSLVIREVLANPAQAVARASRARAAVEKYSWINRAEQMVTHASRCLSLG